jgi:hypothetical protein
MPSGSSHLSDSAGLWWVANNSGEFEASVTVTHP